MSATWSTLGTPAGPFTAVLDEDGAVLASGWTAELSDLLPRVHPRLRPTAPQYRAELGAVTEAVRAYHRGQVRAIDSVVVRQRSAPFTELAWQVLRTVPAGSPVTYTEYAARTAHPAAVRAAAGACARNAVALFVPCHRVVRTGGGLGGFRWGLQVKAWLLDHETSTGQQRASGTSALLEPGQHLGPDPA